MFCFSNFVSFITYYFIETSIFLINSNMLIDIFLIQYEFILLKSNHFPLIHFNILVYMPPFCCISVINFFPSYQECIIMSLIWPLTFDLQINELIINTVETERQKYFLERLLMKDKPLLLVGPTGTGKSAISNNYLLSLPKEKYIINNVNFSAQTSANATQDIIFSKLDR